MAAKEMCSSQKDNCDPSRFDRQMERTVRELRVFYESILKSICIPPVFKYSKFRRSLGDIRSCKNPDVELHAEVDYKQDSFRHAYIFAYSIIHSVTVYDRFSDMMMFNPTMMKRIASMKDIRLCVFGGGPAFEVVAICKLLSNVLSQMGSEGREPLQLRVTVIDICSEWEKEVMCIITSLQRELKTSDNVTINFSFIEADLARNFTPAVQKAFKQAHFITMNKFLTDVDKEYGRQKMFDMINGLIDSMSFKSCIFLLDFSGGGVFNRTDRRIDNIPCIRRIYGPTLHHCCVLKEDTVERFSTNLQNIFPRLQCTVRSTISCSAWIKIRNSGNTANPLVASNKNIPRRLLRNIEEVKSKEREPKQKIKKILQSRQKLNEIMNPL